jgi:hypothetical protein
MLKIVQVDPLHGEQQQGEGGGPAATATATAGEDQGLLPGRRGAQHGGRQREQRGRLRHVTGSIPSRQKIVLTQSEQDASY